jgi:hypothetical protein
MATKAKSVDVNGHLLDVNDHLSRITIYSDSVAACILPPEQLEVLHACLACLAWSKMVSYRQTWSPIVKHGLLSSNMVS